MGGWTRETSWEFLAFRRRNSCFIESVRFLIQLLRHLQKLADVGQSRGSLRKLPAVLGVFAQGSNILRHLR